MRPFALVVASGLALAGQGVSAGRERFPLTAALKPVDLANPVVADWATRPGRLIDVGGYRLNLYCMGQGGPTIVMFSGGGWGAVAFSNIQPALAEHGRVCTYDRAGAGFSDVGPVAPAAEEAMRAAAKMLDVAGERGPFVLVGWSLGGMEARQFAADHPTRVAGIVTIDGSSFDEDPLKGDESWYVGSLTFVRQCHRDAIAGILRRDEKRLRACAGAINPLDALPAMRAAIGDRVLDPAAYAQALHGLEHQPRTFARLRNTRKPFGALPLRVMLASEHLVPSGGGNPAANVPNLAFAQFAVKAAGWSSDGEVIIVPGTGHPIHFARPDKVVATILDVLDTARRVGSGNKAATPRISHRKE